MTVMTTTYAHQIIVTVLFALFELLWNLLYNIKLVSLSASFSVAENVLDLVYFQVILL